MPWNLTYLTNCDHIYQKTIGLAKWKINVDSWKFVCQVALDEQCNGKNIGKYV